MNKNDLKSSEIIRNRRILNKKALFKCEYLRKAEK